MRNIQEIYEWSKITHENIQDFYEHVMNKINNHESMHRGCAMLAHLHYLSNDDFKELFTRFEEYGLNSKDYYHFMEGLVELGMFDEKMMKESVLNYVKSYQEMFNLIDKN